MCLWGITKRAEAMPLKRKGYKVVVKRRGGYYPRFFAIFVPDAPQTEWGIDPLAAPETTDSTEEEYLPGVHAFVDLADAKEKCDAAMSFLPVVVVEVELEGPIVEGWESYEIPVVVYEKMRILREVYPEKKEVQE